MNTTWYEGTTTETVENFRTVSAAITQSYRRKESTREQTRFNSFIKEHLYHNTRNFRFWCTALRDEVGKTRMLMRENNFKPMTFVNVTLNRTHEDAVKEYAKSVKHNPVIVLQDLLSVGYKVSLVWVDSNQAYCLSVIATDLTPANNAKVLTSWSDDIGEVCMLAGYKVFVHLEGGAWPTEDRSSRWG